MQKLLILLLLTLSIVSCKKDEEANQEYGSYILRLTDSPGEYDHVYVDIADVSVNISTVGWVDIGPQVPGIYDLLAYDNGLDTLLSNATLPTGTITQIRLILGTNNSVVVNGVSHNLSVPSAQQSGIKLTINSTISANSTLIEWLDFDAGKSVKLLGNGTYQLNPVLHNFSAATNGRINGTLLPADALAYVAAIKGNDTLIAIPEANGFFQFSGLSGNYQLDFIPTIQTYSSQTLTNNVVIGNQISSIGTITLQ